MTSAPHVLLDNLLQPAATAHIPALSEGFLYGHGVFETIKLIAGRPAWVAHHHARLTASARALDLPYSTSLDTLRERITRLAAANNITDGAAKVVVFNSTPSASAAPTGELITTRPTAYSPENYARGFTLQTHFTGERTGALTDHKTLNYLANIRAKRAAVAAGYDEPLLLTPADILIEGATTNFFIVRNNIAYTPSLASGPLPGIARAQVLALLGPTRAHESLLTHADLLHADEVFVTNALLGVMPVSRIDDRAFALDRAPFTQKLLADYRAHETASLL